MPTIPTYEGNYVAPGQLPTLQYRAPSQDQIDGGVSNMLAHVADASKQIYVQMSETRAEDTANKFYKESNLLTEKYKTLNGEDAAKGFAAYLKSLDDLRTKYSDGIADNAYAAHKFDQYSERLAEKNRQEAQGHFEVENEKHRIVTADGVVNREGQLFIKGLGADDAEYKKAFYARAKLTLGESVDPKELETQWNLVRSKTLAQVGNNILNNDGPIEAAKFVGKKGGLMDPTELASLNRLIETRSKSEKSHTEAFNLAKDLDITGSDYETKRLEIIKGAKDYDTTMALNGLLNVYDGERRSYVDNTAGGLIVSFDPAKAGNGWSAEQTSAYDKLPEAVKKVVKLKMDSLRNKEDPLLKEAFAKASSDIYSDISVQLQSGNREDAVVRLKENIHLLTKEHYQALDTKVANFEFFKDSGIKLIIQNSIRDMPSGEGEKNDLRRNLAIALETDAMSFVKQKDMLSKKNQSEANAALIAHIYETRNKLRQAYPEFAKVPVARYSLEFAPTEGTGTYDSYKTDRLSPRGSVELERALKAEAAWRAQGFKFTPAYRPQPDATGADVGYDPAVPQPTGERTAWYWNLGYYE